MAVWVIENEYLKASVNDSGAELVSLVKKATGENYMGGNDARYWNRVSPVLFPFVGKVQDKTYRYAGVEYTGIPQHGFARDSVFALKEQQADSILFELTPNELFAGKYPFDFVLEIGYKLEKNVLTVSWNVKNNGDGPMYFSIGAHPAFRCPAPGTADDGMNGYAIDLHNGSDTLTSGTLNADGTLTDEVRSFPMENGRLMLSDEVFARDALVVDSSDIKKASLIAPDGSTYLEVGFDTPLLGLWSPVGKHAPFLCIEPWYGRCDREGYNGTLEDREYGNELEAGAEFEASYTITVM